MTRTMFLVSMGAMMMGAAGGCAMERATEADIAADEADIAAEQAALTGQLVMGMNSGFDGDFFSGFDQAEWNDSHCFYRVELDYVDSAGAWATRNMRLSSPDGVYPWCGSNCRANRRALNVPGNIVDQYWPGQTGQTDLQVWSTQAPNEVRMSFTSGGTQTYHWPGPNAPGHFGRYMVRVYRTSCW